MNRVWKAEKAHKSLVFLPVSRFRTIPTMCYIVYAYIIYIVFCWGFFLVTNMYGCLFDNKIIIIIQIKYPHFNCSLTRWIYLLYSTYQNLHTFLCTFCNYQKQHPLVLTVSLNWLFINVRTHTQTNKQANTHKFILVTVYKWFILKGK